MFCATLGYLNPLIFHSTQKLNSPLNKNLMLNAIIPIITERQRGNGKRLEHKD